MNKRIKELMDQAGIDVEAVENMGEMPTALKFAKLIVKECANAVLNNDLVKTEDFIDNSPFFAGWERGVIDSAQLIKKHFGVE